MINVPELGSSSLLGFVNGVNFKVEINCFKTIINKTSICKH